MGKNSWHRVLEANKKQVPLKSYSLEIRINSVNQIFKDKEKVTYTRNISILTTITDQKIQCVYIHVYQIIKIWGPGWGPGWRTRQDFVMKLKKNRNLLKCLIVGHVFCLNFDLIFQFFWKFRNFLHVSTFNFKKLWLFIEILVYSNQEYENVTTSANDLVLWQKLSISKGKNPQNLLKDGYMNNSWEFTLFIYIFLTGISKMVYCS